jgi:hypothetical protein
MGNGLFDNDTNRTNTINNIEEAAILTDTIFETYSGRRVLSLAVSLAP